MRHRPKAGTGNVMYPMREIREGRMFQLKDGRTVKVVNLSGRGKNRTLSTEPSIRPGDPLPYIHIRQFALKVVCRCRAAEEDSVLDR